MPDEPTTSEGETPEETTPATEPERKEPAEEEFDRERAMATITKLREKEKAGDKAAKERDALQAKLDAIEKEKLSESERVVKERDDALQAGTRKDAELQDLRLKLAVHERAGELGIADAELALAALDRSELEYGEDGRPTNLDAALTALLERKPILKGQPSTPKVPSTDAGKGGGKPPSLTADELAMAKRLGMSPEAYAKFRDPDFNLAAYEASRAAAAANKG